MNEELEKIKRLVETLKEDFRMLKDGDWEPDNDSCEASINVADEALEKLENLKFK